VSLGGDQLRGVLDRTADAIVVVDTDWTVDYADERLADWADRDPGAIVGETLWTAFPGLVGTAIEEQCRTAMRTGDPVQFEQRLPDPFDRRVEVRAFPDEAGLTVLSHDVSDQHERARPPEHPNQRLESLIEAAPLAILEIAPDGEVLRWNQGATEMFGWASDEVVGEFNPIVPDDRQSEFDTYRQRALSGERIRGEEIQCRTRDGERLDLLLSAAPVLDEAEAPQSVIAILDDITDRKRTERQLRALQLTARRLNLAESERDVYELAVEAAGNILDLPLTGVWRHDETRDALLPVLMSEAATTLLETQPQFGPGDSLAWEALDAGEVRIYDHLHEQPDRHNPDTPMGSEIIVPLGDRGLMITGSTTPQEFSSREVDLFRVLGATVEAALVRADREAALRQQNDRLDEFASVVAHDLRNPLSIASGFLEVVRETGELRHLDRIESAHDRMERLIDGLLTLAREETTVVDAERLRLDELAEEAWQAVDTEAATMTVAEGGGELAGDRDRLLRLFENLFRNSVEHGSTDGRPAADDAVEHGDAGVTVTVGPLADGDGFYVADDGPGIPPDRREEVFDYGVSYSDDGTGFGLSIVADVARAHGWTVTVTESADGGARFEFSNATVSD